MGEATKGAVQLCRSEGKLTPIANFGHMCRMLCFVFLIIVVKIQFKNVQYTKESLQQRCMIQSIQKEVCHGITCTSKVSNVHRRNILNLHSLKFVSYSPYQIH